jgi:hypothetical protein
MVVITLTLCGTTVTPDSRLRRRAAEISFKFVARARGNSSSNYARIT